MSNRGSPAWRNPRDRMSTHIKKRKSSSRRLDVFLGEASEGFNTESCPPMSSEATSSSSGPSKNPFKKISSPTHKRSRLEDNSPLKELQLGDAEDTAAMDPFSNSTMSQISRKRQSLARTGSTRGSFQLDFSQMETEFSSPNTSDTSKIVDETDDLQSSSDVPCDLRIGTKIRIVSKRAFPWMKGCTSTGKVQFRSTGTEKHDGLKYFTGNRNLFLSPKSSSPMCLIEAASLYWQFPSLPWLSLYPRADALLKNLYKTAQPPLAPQMLESINRTWTECFEQLYLSWKKGDREAFYVCCPSFTIIFTKIREEESNIDAGDESMSCFHSVGGMKHVAVLTPTNANFRQFLKDEGVEWELCDGSNKRRLSKISSAVSFRMEDYMDSDGADPLNEIFEQDSGCNDPVEDDVSDVENDEKDNACKTMSESDSENSIVHAGGDGNWLAEMGVSPRNTQKLRRIHSMVVLSGDKKKKGSVDRCKTAAVLVKGASLQGLYNLVQTSRVVRSIAGAFAHFPPTLLGDQAFLHAQVNTLKKSSQVIKRPGQTLEYVVELEGPILPHSVNTISSFVRAADACTNSEPVRVRVNERSACAGVNFLSDNYLDWSEMNVYSDRFTWKSST